MHRKSSAAITWRVLNKGAAPQLRMGREVVMDKDPPCRVSRTVEISRQASGISTQTGSMRSAVGGSRTGEPLNVPEPWICGCPGSGAE